MADTRRIWQRAAKEIFELREGENDAIRVPIRQVIVERRVLAGNLSCLSRRYAHMLLRRRRVRCRHMPRVQLPSLDPLPHERLRPPAVRTLERITDEDVARGHHESELDARLDGDPCLEFGEIDADATFTGTWTHVNGRPVLRLGQAPLQLRLRLMTDWALVMRRRAFVGVPHDEPSRHRLDPRLERRDFRTSHFDEAGGRCRPGGSGKDLHCIRGWAP